MEPSMEQSTSSGPAGAAQQLPSLKRSRLLTSKDHREKRRRHSVADDSSNSSDDDFSGPTSSSSPLTKRRNVSLSAVAPATTSFVTPPSPPHSSTAFGEFDRAVDFYSESDGPHRAPCRPRHDSINVASLRRRASILNHSGGASLVSHRKRRPATVPQSDLAARARCFEYIVSAIDEVWAQYCSFTSYAEDEMYNEEYGRKPQMTSNTRKTRDAEIPNSPVSLYEEDVAYYSSTNESQGPATPHSYSDSMSLSNQYMSSPKCAQNTQANACLAPSEQPDSVRLLNVKKRLMNAKYYLQDLTDRDDLDASHSFWSRWDMIKYAAIGLVEEDGDDDDEVVESVTEELEDGRYYSCLY